MIPVAELLEWAEQSNLEFKVSQVAQVVRLTISKINFVFIVDAFFLHAKKCVVDVKAVFM